MAAGPGSVGLAKRSGARTDNRMEKRPWPVLLALTRA